LEVYRGLNKEISEVGELFELASEDSDIADEVDTQLQSIEVQLKALELERMLGGEFDGNDALVTINSGAGGTESQDWAQMVMRMVLRWAERKGYKCELLDSLAGEEAGIKSSTFFGARS
ncbi:MAG TPA: PCRF domain-containing protein, partial [Chromatiaceae bacterium]|nr:PCRF domain-containing protein [Chromatiaceae bacterium]